MPPLIFCCTCAALRGSEQPLVDGKAEKAAQDVHLECCGRFICIRCIDSNPRLATYCPFCQRTRLDRLPTPSDSRVLQPPPYAVDDPSPAHEAPFLTSPELPPPYAAATIAGTVASLAAAGTSSPSCCSIANPRAAALTTAAVPEVPPANADAEMEADVQHYLAPTDTLPALSLAYGVPLPALRAHNRLHADNLLSGRRRLAIPRAYYAGPSMAPRPVEGVAESERRARQRRFMMRCKCADYAIATLYLDDAAGDLERAVERWWADEQWEREHPPPGIGVCR